MNQNDLQTLKRWFADYVSTFSTPVSEDQQNIDVKKYHTAEVCAYAVRIARSLNLSPSDIVLAETLGLLHDIGRFSQYQKYKTFKDSDSENHAVLGAKVLIEAKALNDLAKDEQGLIIKAVTLHNVYKLPENLDRRMALFTRLVRDADKLDIWRVAIEYYGQDPATRPTAVGLGYTEGPGYTQDILDSVMNQEISRIASMKTHNDFRLVQLAWIYDLNYAESLRIVLERKYVDALASYLPADDAIRKAVDTVRAYIKRKLGDSKF